MSIRSMALFGSRARGDDEAGSDVDLLLITDETKPRLLTSNKVSFSFYPAAWLVSKAKEGDLFVLHLVREAKVIYDSRNDFDAMCKAFQFQKSYAVVIEQASTLGRFLLQYGTEFEDTSIVNKRIAWCVRTILIAKAAEAGKAIFSAQALAEFANMPSVEKLIKNKSSSNVESEILNSFRSFLEQWGGKGAQKFDPSHHGYLEHFKTTKNALALKTYFSFLDSDQVYF